MLGMLEAQPYKRDGALAAERGVLFGEGRYAGFGNLITVKPPLGTPRTS